MSTYENICFHREIRKISILLDGKKHLIKSNVTVLKSFIIFNFISLYPILIKFTPKCMIC